MGFNNAAMIIAANALRTTIGHVQTHTDDPGSGGTANLTTGVRQALSWAAATGSGNFDLLAPVAFTGIAPNGSVKWVSVWDTLSGGNWYGNFQLVGTLTADASGNYTLQSLPQAGSAS